MTQSLGERAISGQALPKIYRENSLARKTNYSYEKRQKELAKKKKKEEKRLRKLEKKNNPGGEGDTPLSEDNE